ncbi:MAG TPA: hypothetical protein VHC68_02075 [Candidatus Paceibacterota bacterium]|nr:hypothetical protein [Candidatus Paceibacterota bacterium]
MLKLIILIVIGVLALSFFGITIQSIVNSPAGQANFHYIGSLLAMLWAYIFFYLQQGAAWLTNQVSSIG